MTGTSAPANRGTNGGMAVGRRIAPTSGFRRTVPARPAIRRRSRSTVASPHRRPCGAARAGSRRLLVADEWTTGAAVSVVTVAMRAFSPRIRSSRVRTLVVAEANSGFAARPRQPQRQHRRRHLQHRHSRASTFGNDPCSRGQLTSQKAPAMSAILHAGAIVLAILSALPSYKPRSLSRPGGWL